MFKGLRFKFGTALVCCLTASETASKTADKNRSNKTASLSLKCFGFYHQNEGNKKKKVTKFLGLKLRF